MREGMRNFHALLHVQGSGSSLNSILLGFYGILFCFFIQAGLITSLAADDQLNFEPSTPLQTSRSETESFNPLTTQLLPWQPVPHPKVVQDPSPSHQSFQQYTKDIKLNVKYFRCRDRNQTYIYYITLAYISGPKFFSSSFPKLPSQQLEDSFCYMVKF